MGWLDRADSSPHARGSRRTRECWAACGRFIPACTGLTAGVFACQGTNPVHPRVRGAHRVSHKSSGTPAGSSPRARGSSPRARGSSPRARGSRPGPGRVPVPPLVHPRVRGAHPGRALSAPLPHGSSPRARGSPFTGDRACLEERSIPACAGLTPRRVFVATPRPVHPRVRGAHAFRRFSASSTSGSSPRARGSRLTTCDNAGRYLAATLALDMLSTPGFDVHPHTAHGGAHPHYRAGHTGVPCLGCGRRPPARRNSPEEQHEQDEQDEKVRAIRGDPSAVPGPHTPPGRSSDR